MLALFFKRFWNKKKCQRAVGGRGGEKKRKETSADKTLGTMPFFLNWGSVISYLFLNALSEPILLSSLELHFIH